MVKKLLIVLLLLTAAWLLLELVKPRPKMIPIPADQLETVKKKLAEEKQLNWDIPDDPKAKG